MNPDHDAGKGGSIVGSRLVEVPDQRGKRAVVTGTGGLGLQAAQALAKAGAEVILAGRNRAAGETALARIRADDPAARVRFAPVDLADLGSVAALATQLTAEQVAIDVLVCNAGIMSPPRRLETADGFELQFGVNYLGHFALVGGLLPLLRRSDAPRVVSVTSLAQHYARPDFGDLQSVRAYSPGKAYCVSKFAQAAFAQELQRRSDAAGWGVRSVAAHPGMARTDLFGTGHGLVAALKRAGAGMMGYMLGQSAADGAAPILYAATSPDAHGGALYGPQGRFEMRGPPGPSRFAAASRQADVATRLWDMSETLTGVRYPPATTPTA